jgi:predicted outer membrane repeat protein
LGSVPLNFLEIEVCSKHSCILILKMTHHYLILWMFFCWINFSLSAIITVDQSFGREQCNRKDLKCPNLKLAVNITQTHDHIVVNPGQYTGRSNVGICVDGNTYIEYSVCRFQNVTLSGQGPPEKIIIAGNDTAQTRALYVKNSTFVRIENITFDGFTYNRTVENIISEADFATNNIGGAAVALEVSKVHFTHVNFLSNSAATGPASRVINSDASFSHCLFQNNVASLAGGAILADSSNVTFSDCEFAGNNATSATVSETASSGGAIYFSGSDNHYLTVERTVFRNNVAQHTGGAISVLPDPVHKGPQYIQISDSLFENNIANGGGPCESANSCEAAGGALYFSVADIIIYNSKFCNNQAVAPDSTKSASGGAIFVTNIFGARSRVTATQIQNSNFTDNVAYGAGGAIYAISQPLLINGTIFLSNSVSSVDVGFGGISTYGGALWYGGSAGETTVSNCTFHSNVALSGGAIYVTDNGILNVLTSLFIRNKVVSSYLVSALGGAIAAFGQSTLTIRFSEFADNSATSAVTVTPITLSGFGGAIYVVSSSFQSLNNVFRLNSAVSGIYSVGAAGGAIMLVDCGNSVITSCKFLENFVVGYIGETQYGGAGSGGAINLQFSLVNISFCEFKDNWVSAGGETTSLGGAIAGRPLIVMSLFLISFLVNNNYIEEGTQGSTIISYSLFEANIAYGDFFTSQQAGQGGAIGVNSVSGFPLHIIGTNFTLNQAMSTEKTSSAGGAIVITYGSNVTVLECAFSRNLADYGNDVYSQDQNKNLIVIISSQFQYSEESYRTSEYLVYSETFCGKNYNYRQRRLSAAVSPASKYLAATTSIAITGGNAVIYNSSFSSLQGSYQCFFGDYGKYLSELTTGVESTGSTGPVASVTIIPGKGNTLSDLSITAYRANLKIIVPILHATTLINRLNMFYGNISFVNDVTILNTSFLYHVTIKGINDGSQEATNSTYSNITFLGKLYTGYTVSSLSRSFKRNETDTTNSYQNLFVIESCYLCISGTMFVDAPYRLTTLDPAVFPAWFHFLKNSSLFITTNGSLSIGTRTLFSHSDLQQIIVRNYGDFTLAGATQSLLFQSGDPTVDDVSEATGSLTSPVTVEGIFLQYQEARTTVYLNYSRQSTPVLHFSSNIYYEGTVSLNFFNKDGTNCPNLILYETATPSTFDIFDFAQYSSDYSFKLAAPTGLTFQGKNISLNSNSTTDPLKYFQYDVTLTNIGCDYIFDYYSNVQSSSDAGSMYPCYICLQNSSCELCDNGLCGVKGTCQGGASYTSSCCGSSCQEPHGECESFSLDYSSFECVCTIFYTGPNCQQFDTSALLFVIFPSSFVLICCLVCFYQWKKPRIQEIKTSFLNEVCGIVQGSENEGKSLTSQGVELSSSSEILNVSHLNVRMLESSVIKKLLFNNQFAISFLCKIGSTVCLVRKLDSVYFPSTPKNDSILQKKAGALLRIHHRNLCRIYGFRSFPATLASNEPRQTSDRKRSISYSSDGGKSIFTDNYYIFMGYSSHDELFSEVVFNKSIVSPRVWNYGFVLMIAIQVARAILELHSQQPSVFNLNLNSSSVLISKGDWNVKLVDYFMNQIISFEDFKSSIELMVENAPLDTNAAEALRYIAPEIRSLSADDSAATTMTVMSSKVDIYSFGIILWELWERRPIPCSTNDQTEVPPFSEDNSNCPLLFQSLIEECLSVDPLDRPSINSVFLRLNQQINSLSLSETTSKPLQYIITFGKVEENKLNDEDFNTTNPIHLHDNRTLD